MNIIVVIFAIVCGYASLALWVAHFLRARRDSNLMLSAALFALPVISVCVAMVVPEALRIPEMVVLMGGGSLVAARLVPAAQSRERDKQYEAVPRREIKPAWLHVSLISGSALFLVPFVWLVSTSLKPDAQLSVLPPVWLPHPALWRHYPDALEFLPPGTDYGLLNLGNTLVIAIMQVIGTVLSSSFVAYGFARLRWPGRDWVFGLVLATMMLPGAVTMMPQFLIFRSLHWIDTLLPLWVPSFFASAFNVFLLRQFFMSIPTELEDAAKIDGCGPLATWWRVMMPLVKPALAAVSIMTFLAAWKDFMGPLIYISSPEKMPVSYVLQLYNIAHASEPGLLMAATTLVVLPVIVLFFFTQRYFIEGITLTGMGGR